MLIIVLVLLFGGGQVLLSNGVQCLPYAAELRQPCRAAGEGLDARFGES
jgi:hypothetical protein